MNSEEAEKASKLSWEEIKLEYPKAAMVVNYITRHYPDHADAISRHVMLPTLIFSEYSNSEIESMIDKLAIFNHWIKYVPKEEVDNDRQVQS